MRQAHAINHLEAQRLAEQTPHRGRFHPIEHDPQPPTAPNPLPHRGPRGRIFGDPVPGQHQAVEHIQPFGHRRQPHPPKIGHLG